ncbi:hypothetical protein GQ602_002601 [Ophiocordyceps camponoti-floridani]|uniref:Uncharacterized protein n=1 Tax=Ophiocordyceps camponoti-floridani TaxID=2030778 RepID=A0A8H4VFK2_9HYPO|nr:hypothetical protein GQ602_002601 [Ophiocordyceps camponoti-floridani]
MTLIRLCDCLTHRPGSQPTQVGPSCILEGNIDSPQPPPKPTPPVGPCAPRKGCLVNGNDDKAEPSPKSRRVEFGFENLLPTDSVPELQRLLEPSLGCFISRYAYEMACHRREKSAGTYPKDIVSEVADASLAIIRRFDKSIMSREELASCPGDEQGDFCGNLLGCSCANICPEALQMRIEQASVNMVILQDQAMELRIESANNGFTCGGTAWWAEWVENRPRGS